MLISRPCASNLLQSPGNFSTFLFLGADDRSPRDFFDFFFLHFSACLPLPANSALIPPPITLSPPITQNQEKHTPAGLGEVMRLSTLAG